MCAVSQRDWRDRRQVGRPVFLSVLLLYWGCTGAVLEMYLGYTGGVPETYWSCSGIPGDLSASICLSHIVLLLQSAVVFDIITRTCDNQDLRNEGLNQKV